MKLTKFQRLNFIIDLLTQNSRGLTEAEIAEIMQTGRRNVNNWLRELEDCGSVHHEGTPHRGLVWKSGMG